MDQLIGSVSGLWRYPVKSMGGEQLTRVRVERYGIAGDRLFALESAGAPRGKPLVTGAERTLLLQSRARTLLHDGQAASEAQEIEVLLPGRTSRLLWRRLDDPSLIPDFQQLLGSAHTMWIRRSERPQTDCRPLALLSTATLAQLAREAGFPVAAQRFRANLLLDFTGEGASRTGFCEDKLVGSTLRIGEEARLTIKERDPRCRIITVDPETGATAPALMKLLASRHEGKAGIYAATLQTGLVRVGDPVFVSA